MITAKLLGGPYDGKTFVIFSGHALSLPLMQTTADAMKKIHDGSVLRSAPLDRIVYIKRVIDQGCGDLVTVWVPDDMSSDDALKLLIGEPVNERN